MYALGGGELAVPDEGGTRALAHAVAWQAYVDRNWKAVLSAWAQVGHDPRSISDLGMLAHSAAMLGDPVAETCIERLRDYAPTEATLLLGLLRCQQRQVPAAVQELHAGLARLRNDPWPPREVISDAMDAAVQLAAIDRRHAPGCSGRPSRAVRGRLRRGEADRHALPGASLVDSQLAAQLKSHQEMAWPERRPRRAATRAQDRAKYAHNIRIQAELDTDAAATASPPPRWSSCTRSTCRSRPAVNTSPRSRNSWSARKAASASSSEPGVFGTFVQLFRLAGRRCPCRAARPDRSCSGCRRSPPSASRENARYGLQLGSGQRNSSRFAFGLGLYIGMRIDAERLRCE